jgi:hypothetical protein
LLNLGRILSIQKLCCESASIQKDIDARQIRTTLKGISKDERIEHATMTMKGETSVLHNTKAYNEYKLTLLRVIHRLRTEFGDSIIRRRVTSIDSMGMPICNIPPYEEHCIFVNLDQREMEAIETVRKDMASR